MLLTFLMNESVFGCERFYFKWASMLHTYNVYVHGFADAMSRPVPPMYF